MESEGPEFCRVCGVLASRFWEIEQISQESCCSLHPLWTKALVGWCDEHYWDPPSSFTQFAETITTFGVNIRIPVLPLNCHREAPGN